MISLRLGTLYAAVIILVSCGDRAPSPVVDATMEVTPVSPTAIPEETPNAPTLTLTPTIVASAVVQAEVTPAATPTATPTLVPTRPPTQVPTATPTATPTVVPTRPPTQVLAATPSATPTLVPTRPPTQVLAATPAVLSPLRDFDNGPWVEQSAPQLASSIKELSWLRDGITSMETGVIQNLLYIAVVSRPVASAIVSLDWVQDGVDDVEAGAIDWMNNFGDAEVASAVVSLGWLQDGIDDVEVKTIEELSYIANKDTEIGLSVVMFEWVQDGIEEVESEAIDWMNNFGDAEVASAVVSLGWLQDGIDDVEVKTIEELSYIANKDTGVGLSVVALDWVQDGVEGVEADAIDWMNNFGDAEVASAVVSLGWLQDGIDDVEVKTIEELSYIANKDTGVGLSVVALDWVQDGVEGVEADAIDWMNNFGDAEVASAVVSLGWVQDGIEELEVKTIEELSYIANKDTGVGLSVVALDWVQDGVDDVEAGAIDWMSNFGDAEVASAVVSLSWVQDGIDDVEVKTIEELSYIANKDTGVGLSVVALDWVQDGIEEVEAGAIDRMSNFGDAEVASAVVSLGWVQDGIDDVEVKTIEDVSYIAYENAEVASAVVSLSWVQDSVNGAEAALIEDFGAIARNNSGAALQIVGMPFIETIEPPDISAMASLRQLTAFKPETFVRVMSHAALLDGISNDIAPIVATLNGVAGTNPGLIDVLLDSSKVLLERRIITLPLSGDVILFIIRTSPGTERSMDLLEHSVRSVEEYMGAPLPTNYVGLLYENTVPESFAGANFGTHIAILPKFDVDDGTTDAEFAGSNIAHEVAHYYWSGNANWVDEGAAEFMASIVERDRTGRSIGATNSPCPHARNIVELESLKITQDSIEYGCNYSLGERLFLDLNRTLGDTQFQQGFRELYIASAARDDTDDDGSVSIGIEHVMQAFRLGEIATNTVITRWYDGTEPYDLSNVHAGPVDPSLPSINGRIDNAYITTVAKGPAVSKFSAQDVTDRVYLTLKYSYSVSGDPHEVALEIVEYYEDGFVFQRRRSTLTAEDKYSGGTILFSVGSPPGEWAPGRYVVYVYAGERKVAEVEYEVTP